MSQDTKVCNMAPVCFWYNIINVHWRG